MNKLDKKLLANIKAHQKTLTDNKLRSGADACTPRWRNSLYSELKLPGEIWEPFLGRLTFNAALDVRDRVEKFARGCGSPIEELFLLSFLFSASSWVDKEVVLGSMDLPPFAGFAAIAVAVQAEIGKYRADFAITAGSMKVHPAPDGREFTWHKATVLVEVDGHDFHERTKEQASHDKRRDRFLQDAGFRVYRFTGSDVWNRPLECAEEVLGSVTTLAENSPVLGTEFDRDPWLEPKK